MNISARFKVEDAINSHTATYLGIDNTPNDEQMKNICQAAEWLERVRFYLKFDLAINSWFRSPDLNKVLGGSPNSAHLHGWAIDFTCPRFGNPYKVALAMQLSLIAYDQLILEFGEWVHISFDPQKRKQDLTINNPEKKYRRGILTLDSYRGNT